MKVLTILGTRPEIIRLSRVIPLLDGSCEHVVLHTGQNFDPALSDVFFVELGLRRPNHHLGCRSESAMGQIGEILVGCERVIDVERPDRILILGDTNSALGAIVAKRRGIPVYHMEAGNRCYDDRVPEEVNRRIVDHCSDVLMPYTERSRANLIREGVAGERIYVTGNPIREVLDHYAPMVERSGVLDLLGLARGEYVLVTMHRSENVDPPGRLASVVEALHRVKAEYGIEVVCSVHPRTRSRLVSRGMSLEDRGIRALDPLGLFDFLNLERNARCVITDSGTVQEECCIFGIPNVTLRDTTERPETLEAGSNMIAGVDPEDVVRCVRIVLGMPSVWAPIPEYERKNVSCTVAKIILSARSVGGVVRE